MFILDAEGIFNTVKTNIPELQKVTNNIRPMTHRMVRKEAACRLAAAQDRGEKPEIIRTVFQDATNTWAIVLKETGEPITGYWVGTPYWNQGICTEALRLMIDHIRKTTKSSR